jgi:hypothetical protein
MEDCISGLCQPGAKNRGLPCRSIRGSVWPLTPALRDLPWKFICPDEFKDDYWFLRLNNCIDRRCHLLSWKRIKKVRLGGSALMEDI